MKSLLSGLRFFFTVCLCAMMMFVSVVSSASAQAVVKDKPMTNEASEVAKEYERTAKDTIDKGGLQSLEEVRDRSKGGAINEVQGTAGFYNMKRPSNTDAKSIEQQIEEGLDNAGEAPAKLSSEAKKAAKDAEKTAKKTAKQAERAAKKAMNSMND
ncbi:hypothetical protein Q2T42_06875 [Leptolyngbya boryana CZ1]|uniref:Uncharacterized protein n=1 Tax=Leptolyngbya boryana CZ1 TaxID=3060204 RepID=A0AA96WX70_LEPBY|nr:hypothetical protein [Leptolyngbya boryana]WNZ47551.1 hypothetical protein Q2T42_06875 [Leptolyngbya boryana CZ1]